MATNFSPQVAREEFQYPDLLANEVVELAIKIRETVNEPMFFTKHGEVVHQGRDARPNSTTSSLHRPFINHEASFGSTPVPDDSFPCRAIDFHFRWRGKEDYLNKWLLLTKLVAHGGLGVYPWWNNPGFHIDTRTEEHRASYARWYSIRNREGEVEYTTLRSMYDLRIIRANMP